MMPRPEPHATAPGQAPKLRTRLSRPGHDAPGLDDPALAARWRTLEAGAPPFRSWAWVGCLADERYPDPILVELFHADTLVGMALFNRHRRALHLHASGLPALDAVFAEHDGPVGDHPGLLAATLAAVAALRPGQVVLAGLDDAALAAVRGAGGIAVGLHTRPAPYAALGPAPYAEALSRNTRAQLRRSDRSYAASGPIAVDRAQDVATALAWLDRLLPLHRATWDARGVDSGFLAPDSQRFVRTLLARGVPPGTVDMLRVTAGPRTVGYLLNLCGGGASMNYQAGFDYAAAGPHEKPGWTCHHAALERARAMGLREYDFLAGDARYKRSLSTAVRHLHWVRWKPRPPLFGAEALLRRWLRR